MRKTKAFVIVRELCGDAFFLAHASPQELYINAAFESLNAAVSVINFFLEKEKQKKRQEAEDVKIVAETETYRIKLEGETETLRQKFATAKLETNQQADKYRLVMETVYSVAEELRKTVAMVQGLKKTLSRTEDEIKHNRQRIVALDDWLIESTKRYNDLLEYYQMGDEENE